MSEKKTKIYLDYAAATPLAPEVEEAMQEYNHAHFANAFSIHSGGREAKRILESARFTLTAHLGVRSDECLFTAGGTDGAAKAIYGIVNGLLEKGITYSKMHIVMSVIEHSSVRSCVEGFARRGVAVSVVGVTKEGKLDLAQLRSVLRPETILVIAMFVNNETGIIEPITDISKAIVFEYKEKTHAFAMHGIAKPLLLVDASQAPLFIDVQPEKLSVDMLILDAHKIYGPKHTGLLYVRKGIPFVSLCGMLGKTPYEGTPDVASALGFQIAYDVATLRRTDDVTQWSELKESFVQMLTERFPSVRIHGDLKESIPGIINISFENVEGEFLAAQLDAEGIAVSAKSACLSGGGEGSYVVAAMDPVRANNAIRISFGRKTTREDLEYVVSVLADIVR